MAKSKDKFGGVSSEAVRAKTGKDWNEWLEILDGENAKTMPHSEIAKLLAGKYSVPDWWAQMVTVGYEQARGLRAVHQQADGYTANASKTFNAPLSKLYAACADEALQAKWIGRKTFRVSKATPNKSLRFIWGKDDATRVEMNLYAKSLSKSMLQIQHTKLTNAEQVEKTKTYWRKALEKLGKLIGSQRSR